MLDSHDAFLVACYSAHPLVPALQASTRKPVTGILEASVGAALALLRPGQAFGILSTGVVWERLLSDAARELLGAESTRFAGVVTTGLSAIELHDVPADLVHARMVNAARRLLAEPRVGVVCLGCAGMAGMADLVREAAVLERGADAGREVYIIDGVVVGASLLRVLAMSATS
jgi:Asp/Glu/hydantoin racemase